MRPILFSLGPISISSFGFFAAISFLVATFLIWRFSQEELLFSKTPIKEETLFDGIFVFTLATLFGGRVIFILSHFEEFNFNFLRWILVREISGLSFLGGFFVGAVVLFLFCLKKKIPFWDVSDLFSLGGSLALSLAFIGAFLDGVGVGARTILPWGVLFAGVEGRRHPVQLLASGFFLGLFLILKKVRLFGLKRRLEGGVTTFCFVFFLSLILFLLDFLKEGEIYLGWLKKNQVFYLGTSLVGAIVLYRGLKRDWKSDLSRLFHFFKHLKKIKG